MNNDATLRDALSELERLRLRDQRMRRESEAIQQALELLARREPGPETLARVFESVCTAVASDIGVLFISCSNAARQVASVVGPAPQSLDWTQFHDLVACQSESAHLFFDLHQAPEWPEAFRAAMPDMRSGLFGWVRTEVTCCSILLIKEGVKQFEPQAATLLGRHLPVLRQAVVQGDQARRQATLETELLQAQKLEAIGQLAGGIAHEINTPIQYVGDNLRFLQDTHRTLFDLVEKCLTAVSDAKEGRDIQSVADDVGARCTEIDLEYLRDEIPLSIEQSLVGVSQVARIVLAMKAFSHPGSKQKEPADLNRCITNMVTVCRNEWKHVADMELELVEDLPLVPCFVGEMSQVILNLIVNAAQAIEERNGDGMGRISVATRCVGDRAEIRIADTGAGIPDAIRDRIFDPFFTTKPVGKGTGQGLAIAHDVVVTKHCGRIAVESTVGVGTTFTILLPLEFEVGIAEVSE